MTISDAPEPHLTPGQRIRFYRERAGKTRPVLAGLVGRSTEWVKAVENGRILPPRLNMMQSLAAALRVPVADLVGGPEEEAALFAGPAHTALPAVRAALNQYALPTDSPPQPLGHIRARLASAWQARHSSANHRTVLGALLPSLIADAQQAALAATGQERAEAQAVLADVLGLAQMYLAYQPAGDLLWRVVDRAMVAAQESGSPHAIAGATWFAAEAHRDTGDWDSAMAINLAVLRLVDAALPDGDNDLLGLYGALQTGAAFTAARAGESGRAWRHFDLAEQVVNRLPAGYAHPWTWFSGPVLGFYAVSLSVELRRGGEAVRAARRVAPETITSRPRRARHLIEVARGHHLRADHASTVEALQAAFGTAPETIRYNGYAKQITLDLLESAPAELRPTVRDLAFGVGLVTQG